MTVSGNWWGAASAILAILAIGAILFVLWSRRRHITPDGIVRHGPRGGRVISAAIYVGWLFIAFVVWSAGIGVAGAIAGNLLVPIHTEPYWPELPIPRANIGGISFVDAGGLTDGHVYITDLAVGARVWDAIAIAVAGGAFITAALVVIRLCRSLRDGNGILGMARAFSILAVASLIAGFLWQFADQFGAYIATNQVSPPDAGTPDDIWSDWPVAARTLVSISPWPLLPALAFWALAAAFRYAERLEKDTEGLV